MKAFLITILMLLPAVSVAAQQTATISFDRSDVQPDFDENIVRYGDLEPTAVGQSLMLSCAHYLVALAPGEAITELRWESPETEVIGRFDGDDPLTDIPTSAADRYQSVRQTERSGCRSGSRSRYSLRQTYRPRTELRRTHHLAGDGRCLRRSNLA